MAWSQSGAVAVAVERALSDHRFATVGVADGKVAAIHWVVIDEERHPLTMWAGRPSQRTATTLDAIVVTNGPMMGRRIPLLGKVTRRMMLAVPMTTALAVGTLVARIAPRARPPAKMTAGGIASAGAALAAVALLLRDWAPCGNVRGRAARIDDGRDFDDEGRAHAWFGRSDGAARGVDGPPAIGDGALPAAVVEGMGGLVRLVRDGEVATDGDARRLADRRGVVAWGLMPVADGRPSSIVVVGSSTLTVAECTTLMHMIGVQDAVATDPSGCAFLAVAGRTLVGPPPWARRRIQLYGIACGGPSAARLAVAGTATS